MAVIEDWERSAQSANSMTMAAVVLGLSVTESLTANDQNIVANLLFIAAQAISTRASLLPTASIETESSRKMRGVTASTNEGSDET